jgi:lipopolysaccharide transport system ATP-binding protein
MSNMAIRVEGLAKRYRIGERPRHRMLGGALTAALATPFRRLGWSAARAVPPSRNGSGGANGHDGPGYIWALKDVSFEVKHGDVVGIIGRNGAGKSTLFRVLARITEPTRGRAELRGRVAALLEVGTGFHPELSGRDNIYLSGAILGMRRAEIARKFDQIVAFAEVEGFVDTPVKHYSSGMYVRLAFAVAAHLEPEILLVDEVLAVGDAAFQKKCLRKMSEVAREGRTVVVVSHSIPVVENLCSSALLLERGRLVGEGATRSVVRKYLASSSPSGSSADLTAARERSGSGEVRFASIEVRSPDGSLASTVRSGDGFVIALRFECRRPVRRPVFVVSIYTPTGVRVFSVQTSEVNLHVPEITRDGTVELELRRVNLMRGNYFVHVGVGDEPNPMRYDYVADALELSVEGADVYGSGRASSAEWSLVFFDCEWRMGE